MSVPKGVRYRGVPLYVTCMYVCVYVCMHISLYVSISVTVGLCMHCLHMVTSKFVNAGEECACSCVNGTGAVLI